MAGVFRTLSLDAINRPKSGRPGLALGATDIATVLFRGTARMHWISSSAALVMRGPCFLGSFRPTFAIGAAIVDIPESGVAMVTDPQPSPIR